MCRVMKKILILEDDLNRHAAFNKVLDEHDLTIVTTAKEAIAKLDRYGDAWDWLFLDHDLGSEVFVKSNKETGYEVATWLEEHTDKRPKIGVALHSLNPVGRSNMQKALPYACDTPGLWLVNKGVLNQFVRGNPWDE